VIDVARGSQNCPGPRFSQPGARFTAPKRTALDGLGPARWLSAMTCAIRFSTDAAHPVSPPDAARWTASPLP
jgi:hypothetical protein